MTNNYENEALFQRTVMLPSKGALYQNVNPNVTLRGMTIRDEIIRLNASEYDYKPLADMLDRCILNDIGISSYDMCLGDFQYLLFQLRALTYGSSLTLSSRCPYCGMVQESVIKIDDIPLQETTIQDLQDVANIELPVTKERITLNTTTPRILDKLTSEVKKGKRKGKGSEPELFLKLSACIGSIEGVGEDFDIDMWLEDLPMMDVNTILQHSAKLDNMIGMDLTRVVTCNTCKLDYDSGISVTKEFFRPTIQF